MFSNVLPYSKWDTSIPRSNPSIVTPWIITGPGQFRVIFSPVCPARSGSDERIVTHSMVPRLWAT